MWSDVDNTIGVTKNEMEYVKGTNVTHPSAPLYLEERL